MFEGSRELIQRKFDLIIKKTLVWIAIHKWTIGSRKYLQLELGKTLQIITMVTIRDDDISLRDI